MLRTTVNEELQRLQDEGIIKTVTSTKWATPVVWVVKPNGNFSLNGDFKVTINTFLKVEKYALPRVEDILEDIDLNQ